MVRGKRHKLPKISATKRTVQVNTPQFTPPSTAGFGSSGAALKQVGNAIGKLGGMFDAFDAQREKNERADANMALLEFELKDDEAQEQFGLNIQGDGADHVDASNNRYGAAVQEFRNKNYGRFSEKTQKTMDVALARRNLKIQNQAQGQRSKQYNNHWKVKGVEFSNNIVNSMLTKEALAASGINAPVQAYDEFKKRIDGTALDPNIKHALKVSHLKTIGKAVEERGPAASLLKWREKLGSKVGEQGEVSAVQSSGKISKAAVKMIYGEEGLRLKAYLDPVGVPTIGYGHTKGVKLGQTITKEQAVKLAQQDIQQFERAVDRNIKVPLTQNQYDALVSFTFNLGEGNLKKISGDINAGKFNKAAQRMLSYNKARDRSTGQLRQLPGLVKRRQREASLFMQKGVPVKEQKQPDVSTVIASHINWGNVEKRFQQEAVGAMMRGKSSPQQQVIIDQLGEAAANNPQAGQAALLHQGAVEYKKSFDKAVKSDPLALAESQGLVDVEPIMAQGKAPVESIKARVAAAEKVADAYGIEPVYLRPHEKQVISDQLREATAQQKLEFLTGIDAGAGEKAGAFLKELNDIEPALAHAGGLALMGRKETAMLALQGMELSKDKGVKPILDKIADADTLAAYKNVFGNTFGLNDFKRAGPFRATAEAVATSLLIQGKHSNPQDALEEAFSLVSGYKEINGEQYGGIEEFNDQSFIVHPDHKADDVLELFDHLTSRKEVNPERSGQMARGEIEDQRLLYFLEKDGVHPTNPATHRPVTAEDMEDAQFVSISPGKFIVMIDGAPLLDTRKSSHSQKGIHIFTAGSEYVLDLSDLHSDMQIAGIK